MGDKGGKKDKKKNKEQQVKKHLDEAQRKQDKSRPTAAPGLPSAGR
jgi:hypothetical protein